MKLYGSPGCGLGIVEVVLQLANQPCECVEATRLVDGEKKRQAQREKLTMAGWRESSFGK